MPVSSTRLLSAALTGGQPQADKPTFKSSDSLLFGSKHAAGSTVGKANSSHAQLSTAAGRLQHAATASGSMGSSSSSGKWSTWGSSTLQPTSGLSPVGKSSLTATSSGRKLSSHGLFAKAKVTTTHFDSISTSTSTSTSAGAGTRSVSVPRSRHAVFDAARGPAQRPGNRLASQVSSMTSTSAVGIQARSSSTGRSSRAAGTSSAPTAGMKSSSSTSFGFSPYHQTRTAEASSNIAAVPGRARVLMDRALRPSTSSDASMHSPCIPGGLIGSSSALRRSGSLNGTGTTQQQQQQPQFEYLPGPSSSRMPRAFETAPTHSQAVSSHVASSSSSAGKFGSSLHHHAQPPTSANSSYLHRLGLQRAATADAVTCGTASTPADVSSGSAAVAGRRVSSASAATTSDRQTALEKLRGTRMRPRAPAYGDVTYTPAGRVESGAVAAGEDVLQPMRMTQPDRAVSSGMSAGTALGSARRVAHSSSSSRDSRRHESAQQVQEQQQEQQGLQHEDSRARDSAHDIVAALLKRLSSRRLEEAAPAAAAATDQQQLHKQPEQQPAQAAPLQPRPPSAHLQDSVHGRHDAAEQQQQQPYLGHTQSAAMGGPVPLRRVTDGGHSSGACSGPGERLEFPTLQPQQATAAPRSMSGSYLDIMRSNSSTNRSTQQQQQVLQDRQKQDSLSQPMQELTQGQQYHPQLYQQQQVYQPEQYQPLQQQQQRQRLQQQQQQQHQQGSSSYALPPAAATMQRHGVYAPSSATAHLTHLHKPAGVQAGIVAGISSGGGSIADVSGSAAQVYRPPYVPPQAATSEVATRDQIRVELNQYSAVSSGGLLRQPSSSFGPAGSAQPAAAAAAAGVVEQWYSSGSGSVQQGPLQYHQQQQQQQLLLSMDRLSVHDQGPGPTSPQQGFLISTQPMAEHSYDTDTAAAAVGGGDLDVVGPGADQTAAARRAFLTCSTSSSSECSEDHGQDTDTLSAAGAAASRRGSLSTAARTVNGSSRNSSRQYAGDTGQQERRVVATGSSRLDVHVVGRALGRADGSSHSRWDHQVMSAAAAAAAQAGEASDSDSDVSEMTCSSLDSGSSSSSSVDIAVAVRRRNEQDTAAPAVHKYPQVDRSSAAQQQALHGGDASSNSSSPGYASRSSMVGTAAGVASGAAASATSSPVPVKAYARSLSNRVGGLPRGCCGIRNQGNTCYQNSALQLLGCVPELVGALLGQQAVQLFEEAAADAANNRSSRGVQKTLAAAAGAAHAGIGWRSDASVGPALQALVCEMWGFQQTQQRQQRGSPSQMVQRSLQHQQQLQRVTQCMSALREAMAETDPRWDDGDQWDCQEFCLALLQTAHNDSNRVRGKPKYRELKLEGCEAQQAAEAAAYARSWEDSVVLDIFSWQLQSTMTCASCGKRSHAFDSAQELLVAIPPDSEDVTVQQCLTRTTFSPEKMVGEEGYKCESCKALTEATKQLQLFTYPQVLLLGLKRFETRGGSKGGNRVAETYSSRKVSTRVRLDAGELLDLSPFCNPAGLKAAAAAGRPPPRYELIAVADHTGYINGGHYTARGRSLLDGSWVEFNDSLVLATDAPSGSTREAYMMLYRLVG